MKARGAELELAASRETVLTFGLWSMPASKLLSLLDRVTHKCGKLLARSPELGERVQFLNPKECTGRVWLVDYHRHLACVHVDTIDGIALQPPHATETLAWTALRPCNGEPIR